MNDEGDGNGGNRIGVWVYGFPSVSLQCLGFGLVMMMKNMT